MSPRSSVRLPPVRGARGALAALALLLAATGCSSLPTDGTVRAGTPEAPGASQAPFDFDPPGPPPGATKTEVVSGFLTSLQASPVSTHVSEQYLARDAVADWHPDRRTLVYTGLDSSSTPAGVRLAVETYVALDAQGRWLRRSEGRSERIRLHLVREGGEWRIADPPDATVVPQSHFELRYSQFFLYFADPTGTRLVPEPVYLPWGTLAPTLLVAGLLAGPPPGTRGVERSWFPAGTTLDISVPVDADGTAEVPLSGPVLDLDPDARELALAQLAFTLRQLPTVRRLRATADGTPLGLPGVGSTLDLDAAAELDPAVPGASTSLFGMRSGRVVEVADGQELALARPLDGAPVRSLAVDLTGTRVAVVSADGTTVTEVPRIRNPRDDGAHVVWSGTSVVQPSWDGSGRLWLVDDTGDGAEVVVVHRGRARRVAAPGITGRRVVAVTVSRDGSRLAAVVSGRVTDRVVVSRVVRSSSGAPARLTRAETLSTSSAAPGRELDLAWRSPALLAVLTVPSPGVTQVVLQPVDGSTGSAVGLPTIEPLRARGTALATWPGAGAPLVVGTRSGDAALLTSSGSWTPLQVRRGLRDLTFVG